MPHCLQKLRSEVARFSFLLPRFASTALYTLHEYEYTCQYFYNLEAVNVPDILFALHFEGIGDSTEIDAPAGAADLPADRAETKLVAGRRSH